MARSVLLFEIRGRAPLLESRFTAMGDAGAALPAGAYTTLRTFGGRQRVLDLRGHVARLEDSAARLGQPGTLDVASVAEALAAALPQLAGTGEARIRLTFAPPGLWAALEPFPSLPEALRRDGVACVTVSERRADARAKDTRFAAVARRAAAALPPGVHEGLMVDRDGALLEGLSSNFFAVRDGVLRTEGDRVLPGLTRAQVLELAGAQLPVELRAVSLEELPAVSECFITSSSRGVLGVIRIDSVVVGEGRPGPVTQALAEGLDRRIEAAAERLEDLAR